MNSGIYCTLDEWRYIVRHASGEVADRKSYARRPRRTNALENALLLILTKLNSVGAFDVKPCGRAVLCKRFEIRARQVEINRKIAAVLINSGLNGLSSHVAVDKDNGTVIGGYSLYMGADITLRKWMHFSRRNVSRSFKLQTYPVTATLCSGRVPFG